jgi:hypothetical protein
MDAKTDESHGAVAGQVERSVRRAARTASAFFLRLVLLLPWILLRGLFAALSEAFGSLADSMYKAERALHQAADFPFARDIRKALAEANEEDRRAMLEALKRSLD